MRERMGPYEIPVSEGEPLDAPQGGERVAYSFRLHQTSDKLVQGGECNLLTDHSDDLVTVVSIDGDRIVLTSGQPLDLPDGRATLVIYPWFLYERLQEALRGLGENDGFHTDTALSLFGKTPARHLQIRDAATDHVADSLNPSQRQAVALCLVRTPAFVWGPPGTGKTTTLSHIVLSLLRLGQRVLVTSTTDARLVLATMTNVYMSSLMSDERFDAVIAEEAGMAVLPTLFYCASLARSRVIMVGDPQQLPPIVQSSDPFVQQAMGRNIFHVTVPEPHRSDLVVMLDTQYRMHPHIGDLVGDVFYEGRLRHGAATGELNRIAACAPCPGAAIVVADTAGTSTCRTPDRSYSRFNETHAAIAVKMARQAVDGGAGSVAIIAPYVEQVRQIGRLLAADPALSDRVECRTVHRFQGGERDVVIVDTVDAEPLSPGRLLSDRLPTSSAANLINVSVSRARGKLVIVADAPYFRRRDPAGIISRVLAAAQRLGTVVEP